MVRKSKKLDAVWRLFVPRRPQKKKKAREAVLPIHKDSSTFGTVPGVTTLGFLKTCQPFTLSITCGWTGGCYMVVLPSVFAELEFRAFRNIMLKQGWDGIAPITAEQFGGFWRFFGPFVETIRKVEALWSMLCPKTSTTPSTMEKKPVLYGYLSRDETESILFADPGNVTPGSFLIRFTESFPGDLVLVFTEDGKKVEHQRFHVGTDVVTAVVSSKEIKFPSVADLLKEFKEKKKISKSACGSNVDSIISFLEKNPTPVSRTTRSVYLLPDAHESSSSRTRSGRIYSRS